MSKNFPEMATDLTASVGRLSKGIPETMKGFADMRSAAHADGCLEPKTKELIATAISVAVRCDGCIASHTKAAEKSGASREEVLETLSMAVLMGGGPSVVYAAQALDAYDQFTEDAKKSKSQKQLRGKAKKAKLKL
jgi:AhpD family alkylhydroperoxidase